MKDVQQQYRDYGEYNILYNQLNMPSPSVEYAWRKTKKLLQDEAINQIMHHSADRQLSVCDIGCGNGALLMRLAELTRSRKNVSFEGFDLSDPFIAFGEKAAEYKNLKNVTFHHFDIEHEDFSKKYDVIICSEVLEHLHAPQDSLKKMFYALEDDGLLLLSTPNAKNMIKYPFLFLKNIVSRKNSGSLSQYLTEKEKTHVLAEMEQHLYVYSHGELRGALKKTGFTNIRSPRSTTFFGGPFFDDHAMLFSLSIMADVFFDILHFSQIGWDNIFFCRK